MKIQTSGEVLNYQASPVIGKQLILTVADDLSEALDQIQGEPVEITIKPIREKRKRSRNANNYMWVLLTKLQNAGFGNARELYRRYIREYGVSEARAVPEAAFLLYKESYEKSGEGYQIERTGNSTWVNDKGERIAMTNFVQYAGSHVYNKRQMSQLLDGIVQDCKAVGIQTETPEELARMIEELND